MSGLIDNIKENPETIEALVETVKNFIGLIAENLDSEKAAEVAIRQELVGLEKAIEVAWNNIQAIANGESGGRGKEKFNLQGVPRGKSVFVWKDSDGVWQVCEPAQK